MKLYGISAIRIDHISAEISMVKLHETARKANGDPGFDKGREVTYDKVASLLFRGDTVRVLEYGGAPDIFRPTDFIRVKSAIGPLEFIESYDSNNRATTTLFELPIF